MLFLSCSFPDSLNNFNTHDILVSDSRDKYFNIHDSFKLLEYPEKKVDWNIIYKNCLERT